MSSEKETFLQVSWPLFKQFLSIFLPLALLLGITLMLFYNKEIRTERIIFESQEAQHIRFHKEETGRDLKSISSDLMFLAGLNELHDITNGINSDAIKDLSDEFLLFCKTKGIYDQIRFLNKKGMEVVRINFNKGKPYIVPEDQLQSKVGRYYFKDSFGLAPGEVFVSPFDLNLENGEIEQPLKPMIRFGTPVFYNFGRENGIVILNYLGKTLLDKLSRPLSKTSGILTLLNSDGYWLKGPNPEDEWGFMRQDKKKRTFGKDFPKAWQQISEAESGQFYSTKGVFTFATVYPILPTWKSSAGSDKPFELSKDQDQIKANEYYWKIVSFLPLDTLKAKSHKLLLRLLRFYAVFGILLAVGSWFLAAALANRKLKEAALKSLNVKIIEKNKALEQMMYIASHDLRSPMVNIHGYSTELIKSVNELCSVLHKSDNLEPDRKKLFKIMEAHISMTTDYILSSTTKMQKLLKGLLNISRIDQSPLTIQNIEMNNLVSQVINQFDYQIRQNGTEVKIEKLPQCIGDKIQIYQVFSNLIDNALKYSSNERKCVLRITGKEKRGRSVYCVEDNGIGIEPHCQEAIFNIFYRCDTKVGVGDGLGLSIIEKILHNLDGKVWFESGIEKGSRFFVSLPSNKKK